MEEQTTAPVDHVADVVRMAAEYGPKIEEALKLAEKVSAMDPRLAALEDGLKVLAGLVERVEALESALKKSAVAAPEPPPISTTFQRGADVIALSGDSIINGLPALITKVGHDISPIVKKFALEIGEVKEIFFHGQPAQAHLIVGHDAAVTQRIDK